MRQYSSARRTCALAAIAVSLGLGSSLYADQLQNTAARASNAALIAAGFSPFGTFGPLNGELVTVGVIEAGGGIANLSSANLNTSPNSMLPNGNSDLPSSNVKAFQFTGGIIPTGGINTLGGPVGNPYPSGLMVGNHASEVTGVVVGQGKTAAADIGIAPGATVQQAGLSGGATAPNGFIDLSQRAMVNGASIINYSLGVNLTPTPPPVLPGINDGSNIRSLFVDWAANQHNILSTIAGNEVATEVDAPPDSFNGITVGATSSRTNYDQADPGLNVSSNGTINANRTFDGRIGVSLVAPGGDTGRGSNAGTFAVLPTFGNQFQTTAGGQFEFAGTTQPKGAGDPIYDQDSFGGVSTAKYGFAVDNANPLIANPYSAINPGANLGGGDSVISSQLAGTSFSAPLVAGAGAVVSQYGLLATGTNAKSNIGNFPFSRNAVDPMDHRVLKAILMNGASKINVDGTELTRSSGTAWTRSNVIQGAKPLPAPLAALAVGPTSNQAQSGLDPQLGAGQLSLVGSLTNYAAGEQGPGAPGSATVLPTGWDFEDIGANSAADTTYSYDFTLTGPAKYFQATLAWDSLVNINNAGSGNTFQVSGSPATTSTLARDPNPLADLDLYFFQVNPNGTLVELGWSNSNVDNVEHIFNQPTDPLTGLPTFLTAGNYQLDVVLASGIGAMDVPYGLAWMVPEPAAICWLGLALPILMRRRVAS